MSTVVTTSDRLEVLFGELSELAGQRNAIDGRIVEIVAEMDRDRLCGATGARSVAALVAWKLGSTSANAHTICVAIPHHAAAAHRLMEILTTLSKSSTRRGRLSMVRGMTDG